MMEPMPRVNGHPGGDVATEELAGHLTGGAEGHQGHFTTHFDEPSLDYSTTHTEITETTLEEMRLIAARYPQARSALLPMLHLV